MASSAISGIDKNTGACARVLQEVRRLVAKEAESLADNSC